MDPPPGSSFLKKSNQVCKLNKSLYGLKQASRQWFAKLTSVLLVDGYVQSKEDYSFFCKHIAGFSTLVILYVDDILVTGSHESEIRHLKQLLDINFTIKDLGHIKYYLGMEVSRSSQGILVHQRKYILDLLQDFGQLDSKPFTIAMEQHIKLHDTTSPLLLDPSQYRCLIGKMQYLTMTRPDISFTINFFKLHVKITCRLLSEF